LDELVQFNCEIMMMKFQLLLSQLNPPQPVRVTTVKYMRLFRILWPHALKHPIFECRFHR